ncbi:MAG: hypothetical protein AAF335_02215 [Bacteroidota bacterium]
MSHLFIQRTTLCLMLAAFLFRHLGVAKNLSTSDIDLDKYIDRRCRL